MVYTRILTVSAQLLSCEKDGQWEQVLDLLVKLPTLGIAPSETIHTAAMATACGENDQRSHTAGPVEEMQMQRLSEVAGGGQGEGEEGSTVALDGVEVPTASPTAVSTL